MRIPESNRTQNNGLGLKNVRQKFKRIVVAGMILASIYPILLL